MRHINYVPSTRTVRIVWYVAAAGMIALFAWLVWAVVSTSHNLQAADEHLDATNQRLDEARSERNQLMRAAESNAEAAAALAAQVRELGERPVVDPTPMPQVIPGPPGPAGLPGPRGPGPTAAEVQRAVDAYCAGGRCDGRDGRDVTPDQVAAAVAAYCNARGECRGDVGPMGPTGPPGAPGKDAPPPTQEQVNQAVANYCADGRCRGPKGEEGPRGEPGTARPGTYMCDDGEFVRGFTIAPDGTVTLNCQADFPPR